MKRKNIKNGFSLGMSYKPELILVYNVISVMRQSTGKYISNAFVSIIFVSLFAHSVSFLATISSRVE